MTYVVNLEQVGSGDVADVGAKAAHVGELMRMGGLMVPGGFCVTGAAFARFVVESPSITDRLDRLSSVEPGNLALIRALSTELRRAVEDASMPEDVVTAIGQELSRFTPYAAFAVRSSATAEDLPRASFAGQHDSYLQVMGEEAIVGHVRRCWASLFSERAVLYRRRNGFHERGVQMAVLVQEMVAAEVAGVLFTADPVTSNRGHTLIEATWGLAESLVAGRADADVYRVKDGVVVDTVLAQPARAALSEAQVLILEQLGRRIEAHLGSPQDIEWCLLDGEFHIVQSRPITTLFPVPVREDNDNHVYASVGHQQMMTDAMTPLGLSMWQLTAMAPMYEAGGRLFVDVTMRLASPQSRSVLLESMGRGDPLVRDALEAVVERGDFLPEVSDDTTLPAPRGGAPVAIESDPAIVTGLIARSEASVDSLRRDIETKTGPALFDFLLEAFEEHKRALSDPVSMQALMAGMTATWWLNDHLQEWLGETNAADTLTLSAPGNITSQMGLELLDVADVVRAHPNVVAFLQVASDDHFMDELPKIAGGQQAHDAIESWLDTYGMRCVGEIDIARARWREHPAALLPMIMGNVRNFEPGAAQRRFEQGRQAARAKEQEILERLRALPEGEARAAETKRMIERVRTFIGYREYPKYGIICRYFLYKKALLAEAERLMQAKVIADVEDVFYLTFEEFHGAARTNEVDQQLIAQRKEAFRSYQLLRTPRVLTSDGEVIAGSYRRDDAPGGALVGVPVSTGTVEGRARIVLDPATADLESGDILVTRYTDPSWTPVFLTATALVTEVGGLMTHGAVVAREYGLPAVVGVEGATQLIRDGQRIRVSGTTGYVELVR